MAQRDATPKVHFRQFEQARASKRIERPVPVDRLLASSNLLSVLLGMNLGISLS